MFKIEIKQKHIDRAKKIKGEYSCTSASECPIALAIKEKTHKTVFVAGSFISINRKSYLFLLNDLVKAINFQSDFDNNIKVYPITLIIEKR